MSKMRWLMLLALAGCQNAPQPLPTDPGGAQLAKPGPAPGTGAISVTLHNVTGSGTPTDLVSDGRGPYTAGVCGVSASTAENAGTLFAFLWPAATSPAASCGGARAATVRMLARHLSDSPHVDDAASPIGDLPLTEIAAGLNGVAKVNAPTLACFHSSRGGKGMSGIGMRFNSAVYPGSSYLSVTVTGDRLWHVETYPYPNNIGYCEGDLGVSYWHMNINFDVVPAS